MRGGGFFLASRYSRSLIDQLAHVFYGLVKATDHRTGNDAMADVQLVHSGNCRDRQRVVIVQTVAGVNHQPQLQRQRCCLTNTLELCGLHVGAGGIGIVTGMNFYGGRTTFTGRANLCRIRIDK